MEFEHYTVILAPAVEKEIDNIYAYIAGQFSETAALNKVTRIVKALESLSFFPERGFNADDKFGKQIDPPYQTRGYVIDKDYLALYRISDKEVRVGSLFSTRSDYVKLFKS